MCSPIPYQPMNRSLPELPDTATPQEILQAGIAAADGVVKLACSFSMEDIVLIDLIQALKLPVGIFAIDTGRLNEETYEVADALTDRYRISIDWYFPVNDVLECLLKAKGQFSFRESLENRKECCRIRKVEPLGRALEGLSGWITGMRREQGITRSDLPAIEHDQVNAGILKINPLVSWSERQVIDYAAEHNLPINRLYKQGYRSIGCAPCTRAIGAWDHPREGRWWWESAEHKECGLHRR